MLPQDWGDQLKCVLWGSASAGVCVTADDWLVHGGRGARVARRRRLFTCFMPHGRQRTAQLLHLLNVVVLQDVGAELLLQAAQYFATLGRRGGEPLKAGTDERGNKLCPHVVWDLVDRHQRFLATQCSTHLLARPRNPNEPARHPASHVRGTRRSVAAGAAVSADFSHLLLKLIFIECVDLQGGLPRPKLPDGVGHEAEGLCPSLHAHSLENTAIVLQVESAGPC